AIGDELLRVEHLTLARPGVANAYLLEDVCFSLHAGEILGIYGLMGAGRTELFEALIGLFPQAKGHVWLNGKEIK
ncbi:MAG TPA: ATP-binding cassette domain-containing protein, partial [Aggregatilineales bacterium]|nr:ATP-binding cassette domain-containing protein [Aggregatilineales bacterium]